MGKRLSKELEKMIHDKKASLLETNESTVNIVEDQEGESPFTSQVIASIVTYGDAIGAVILASKDEKVKMGEIEIKLAETAANFLGKQMEQ